MTKSELPLPYPPIPERLQRIDELTFSDHYHIDIVEDDCFYLWERVSGAKYDEYPTNQLIANIQIPVAYRGQPRWYWKGHAISYAARALATLIPEPWVRSTFVPVPPSLTRENPSHDPRILNLLRGVRPRLPDVRELVLLRDDGVAKQKNISPEERAANYQLNDEFADPEPQDIIIVDDVLAGGSHFKAMKMVLRDRYPAAGLYGLFLARATHPTLPDPIVIDFL